MKEIDLYRIVKTWVLKNLDLSCTLTKYSEPARAEGTWHESRDELKNFVGRGSN